MENVKRVSAELQGEQTVMFDTLCASLQLKGSKKEVEGRLIDLALNALELVVKECSVETGKKFPNEGDVREHLAK